eukprot:CAMPEP_0119081468 /NCGR_PEP_ID=MMETSP1178-20130426/116920_1 /TAXON_ID=33656 /ORGANISM="unid sp, Strain CCMP2000" /LENGTH=235 /DNA_ID=CAMNT_0007064165 /DNA_START=15 /DNA_END=718 /DNA_ORIENTATION=+
MADHEDAEPRAPLRERRREKEEEDRRFKPRHYGDTALHAGAGAGNWEVVDMLLRHDTDVNSTSNSDGSTPLMRSCEGAPGVNHANLLKCAQSLLADPRHNLHQLNFAGHNALHVALDNRMLDIADLLIDAGAKPCENAGRRCQRCQLGIKSRKRARVKPEPVPVRKENTEQVLREEFGDGDFLAALSLAKEELGPPAREAVQASAVPAAGAPALPPTTTTRRGGKKKKKGGIAAG